MCARRCFVFALFLAIGTAGACGGESTPPAPPAPPAQSAPSDEHAHDAPRGGTLVELGEHFAFLEFVLDRGAGSLTVYVLDGEAEQSVRLAQPAVVVAFDAPEPLTGQTLTLAAQASTLTGETVGDSSQFAVSHESLRNQTAVIVRLTEVTVKGQVFRELTVALDTNERPPFL